MLRKDSKRLGGRPFRAGFCLFVVVEILVFSPLYRGNQVL